MNNRTSQRREMIPTDNDWWNPVDVLDYLEVLPEEHVEPHFHTYRLRRGRLSLSLTIAYHDRSVEVALFHNADDVAIFELSLLYCEGIRYINDKRGEYLEFGPGQVSSDAGPELEQWPYSIRLYAKHRLAIRVGLT
jgi:hypothetical protein